MRSRRLLKYNELHALPLKRSARSVGLLGLRVRRSQLLDAQLGQPLALVDGGLEVVARDDAGEETTGESITVVRLAN